MTRIIVAVALLGALAGCNTVGLTSSFCDAKSGIVPIRLTKAEIAALQSDTKRNILAIDKYGEANCRWVP